MSTWSQHAYGAPGVAAETEYVSPEESFLRLSSPSFQTAAAPGTTDLRRVYPTTVTQAASGQWLCRSCFRDPDVLLSGANPGMGVASAYCFTHGAEWLGHNLRRALEVAYHVEAGLDSMEAEKQVRRLEE